MSAAADRAHAAACVKFLDDWGAPPRIGADDPRERRLAAWLFAARGRRHVGTLSPIALSILESRAALIDLPPQAPPAGEDRLDDIADRWAFEVWIAAQDFHAEHGRLPTDGELASRIRAASQLATPAGAEMRELVAAVSS